jgi:hypothetical protein
MMFNVRIPQATFAMLLATAAAANAANLVNQPPQTDFLNGLQVDNSTGPFSQTFTAPALSVLESITWWGFHGGNSGGSAFDDFAVHLGGVPQAGTLTVSTVLLDDQSELTRYTLDVVDVPLTATSLEIVNDSLDVEWFWQYAAGGGPNADNLAYALTGSLVLEPATHLMVLAGLAGIAGFGRRGFKG